MWAIRILNGNLAGEIIALKEGSNKIGRATTADIQINAGGISKEHLEISMINGKLAFTDLNSSNGTFLNGVRTKSGNLKLGDKMSLHNIIFDIVALSESSQQVVHQLNSPKKPTLPDFKSMSAPKTPAVVSVFTPSNVPVPSASYAQPFPQEASPQASFQGGGSNINHEIHAQTYKPSFMEKLNGYVENVMLVGFYQIIEKIEMKMVLMSFVAIYIAMVTLLAIFPMKQITSESITNESRRRAMTVARALARGNEKILKTGEVAHFSTEFAMMEDGIEDVYVVGKDGRIMAPTDRTGAPPKEIRFFRDKILKAGTHEVSGEIGDRIEAAVPIIGYDTETQKNTAKAYAVVIYNPGNLMYDDGKVFGLFIQMLALGLLAGGVLFFIMFKLVEYPFQQLNKELDLALRDSEKAQVEVKVKLPALHVLATNINSLLSRLTSSNSDSGQIGIGAKHHEYVNMLSVMISPGLLIATDGTILKCSPGFEELTGVRPDQVEGRKISELDQGLQRNIEGLMSSAISSSSQLVRDQYEFNSGIWSLNCQALTLPTGEIDCFIILMVPGEGVSNVA